MQSMHALIRVVEKAEEKGVYSLMVNLGPTAGPAFYFFIFFFFFF
jgi:hypothetical protein